MAELLKAVSIIHRLGTTHQGLLRCNVQVTRVQCSGDPPTSKPLARTFAPAAGNARYSADLPRTGVPLLEEIPLPIKSSDEIF